MVFERQDRVKDNQKSTSYLILSKNNQEVTFLVIFILGTTWQEKTASFLFCISLWSKERQQKSILTEVVGWNVG